jgi:GxxExxY protein
MSVACCWNSGCAASERSPKPPSPYMYKGRCVGEYFADILVEHSVVIELKCVDRLGNEHMSQCLNYLRASGMEVCLLINFQKPSVDWKRIVYSPLSVCD